MDAAPDTPAPDEVIITYLEMTAPPAGEPPSLDPAIHVMRSHPPTVAFYRFLYQGVGGRWQWNERSRLNDGNLQRLIQHPEVALYVLYRRGTPAGFAELDYRHAPDTQLVYFGLFSDFIGQGLGSLFLEWTIHRAWHPPSDLPRPERLWLHTCTDDHPRALPLYQKKGFRPFKREKQNRPT